MGKTGMIRLGFGSALFYALFLIMPILLFIGAEGTQLYFDGFYQTLSTIGRLAGIVGLCFFSGNLILSGRYTFLDKLFGGLDRIYLFHRRTGVYVFFIISLHFLAMSFGPLQNGFMSVIDFAFDFTDIPTLFGKLAYGFFVALIIVTIYFAQSFKYERIKWIHSWMGAAFMLGGVHAYLIPSDISFIEPLRWYVLSWAFVASASYLVRTVGKRWLVPRMTLDVVGVNALPGNITEIVMEPRAGKRVNFIAGQFIFVKFKQDGFPLNNEEHPFSLTASVEEGKRGRIRISAKALGDFTKALPLLSPGAVASVQGPYGGFSFIKDKNRKQVWVAGGIGITPFISMARTMRDQSITDFDIDFYYSVQTEGDLVFIDELREISSKLANFRLYPWIAQEKGYLSAEIIGKETDLLSRDIFLCGPQPMMTTITGQLHAAGVPNSRIHFEMFKLL